MRHKTHRETKSGGEGFSWTFGQQGARLKVGRVDVLEIRRAEPGWIVEVWLSDMDGFRPRVEVRTLHAGLCWGARWARARLPYLFALSRNHEEHSPGETTLHAAPAVHYCLLAGANDRLFPFRPHLAARNGRREPRPRDLEARLHRGASAHGGGE